MKTPQEMRALAGAYLEKGYSVIPIGLDKRPLIAWKEFQLRRATESELDEWFKDGSVAQIGIVTGGISNLTVVDVEKDGDTSLFDKYITYAVKTGGGGYHYYFNYSRGTTNEVRRLPLTDLRSEGGYVVAAGSVSSKGEYEEWVPAPVAEMPEEVLEIFKKPVYTPSSEPRIPVSVEYEGSGEGSRNDALTRYVGRLLASMSPGLWETVAWPLILAANQKNTPPLPEYEVRLIFMSISSREMPKTSERAYGEARSRPTNQGSSVSNVVDAEAPTLNPIITLGEAARTQKIDVSKVTPTNIAIFDEALLGGFSPGDLVLVIGRSGNGKTSLVQDFSASFLSAGHGVLWFSYEVMADPLYQKFTEMGLEPATFEKLYVPTSLTSTLEEIIEICTRAHNEFGVQMVAIDHMGFIDAETGKHGNHALATTQNARALKRMAIENEMTVILPVHVRKTAGTEPELEDIRDSYGIVQEADTAFIIDRKRAPSEQREQTYYSDNTKIVLAKNRKTGVSKAGIFSLVAGRFAYQEGLTMAAESEQGAPRGYRKGKDDVDREWEKEMASGAV